MEHLFSLCVPVWRMWSTMAWPLWAVIGHEVKSEMRWFDLQRIVVLDPSLCSPSLLCHNFPLLLSGNLDNLFFFSFSHCNLRLVSTTTVGTLVVQLSLNPVHLIIKSLSFLSLLLPCNFVLTECYLLSKPGFRLHKFRQISTQFCCDQQIFSVRLDYECWKRWMDM